MPGFFIQVTSKEQAMNDHSKVFRFFHFTLTRIFLGILSVVAAALLAQVGTNALLKFMNIGEELKNLVVAVVTAALTLVTYIYLFKNYEKRAITELSTSGFAFNAISGFVTGFLILSLVILVMYLGNAYTIISVNPVSFLLPALSVAISSAVFEELLFRGVIFRISEEKLGSAWALVISSSIFGFGHIGNPNSTLFSAVAIVIEAGLLLGAAYIYSRNLWLPVFIHFAWNLSEGGIYGAAVSGTGISKSLIIPKIHGHELLTGGSFGPENSLPAVIFGVLAAALFLWKAGKKKTWIKPSWRHKKSAITQEA